MAKPGESKGGKFKFLNYRYHRLLPLNIKAEKKV